MESTPHDNLLRLKVASEIVLGNQAAVAFSRAFYLEDLLIERILNEFHELSHTWQTLLDQVQKFTEEVLNSESSSKLTPLSESSARCQCSEMLESLGTVHQPSLESFQQKIIQAKARRQAKSSLLETLSAQNQNITAQFNSMTLAQLINQVHIPEFSCFINDSDFGQLEQLTEDWDSYRKAAKEEFDSFEKKLDGFRQDIEKNKRMREFTCDMILAKITEQQHQPSLYGADTLKKKGVFHKFSTLLRRRHTHHTSNATLNMKSLPSSPTPSSKFSVAEGTTHQESF